MLGIYLSGTGNTKYCMNLLVKGLESKRCIQNYRRENPKRKIRSRDIEGYFEQMQQQNKREKQIMKLPKFSKETKNNHPTPPWMKDMDEGDFNFSLTARLKAHMNLKLTEVSLCVE